MKKNNTWLLNNTALDRRLEMVYDDNPAATITDFTNVSADNDALEEIIAEMPEIPAMEYALKVIANFPDAATAATLALGVDVDTITLAEHHIYGSSRLGIQTYDTTYRNTFNANPNITPITRLSGNRSYYSSAYGDYVQSSYKEPWGGVDNGQLREQRTLGRRYYELTDHLGNVLATVMDRKTGAGHSGAGTLYDHWMADLATVQDYYPGGMLMPGRWKAMNSDTTLYRFGAQGGYKDNEIYGFGGWTDLGARGFMNNIMRFPSPDTWEKKYPDASTYSAFNNNPIYFIDPTGKGGVASIEKDKNGNTQIRVVSTIYVYSNAQNIDVNHYALKIQDDINSQWNNPAVLGKDGGIAGEGKSLHLWMA